MKPMIVLLLLGTCWMAAAIIYGMVASNIPAEVRTLIKCIWFWISMADLYTGFMLFSGWIIFRERSWAIAVPWIILLLTLGNLTSCVYALIAAVRARGNWRLFWLGKHAA
jgi:Protein of unknown function (DUF1475)